MNGFQLKNIKKFYDKTEVLKGINLEASQGEFLVILGPSGCGKSTLLRIIAGLDSPSEGEIFFNKKNVTNLPPKDRGVAKVFQSYALYPHMNVADNIGLALRLSGEKKEILASKILNIAKILKIEKLLARYPKELSGGQKQRVAIGRAIIRNPNIFLFDEPLSNLDTDLRLSMRREINKLRHQLPQTTMIYVTHDQGEAMTLADRIVLMKEGRIEQIGSPEEIYSSPRNTFVANFLGSEKINFLPITLKSASDKGALFKLGDSTIALNKDMRTNKLGTSFLLGIRPHDFSLEEKRNSLSIKVEFNENLGGTCLYHGYFQDTPINASITQATPIKSDKMIFYFNEKTPLLFNPQGSLYSP